MNLSTNQVEAKEFTSLVVGVSSGAIKGRIATHAVRSDNLLLLLL